MLITHIILGLCIILSLYAFSEPKVKAKLMFSPYYCHSRGEWYRVFTHAFIHGDYMHLFMNMFVLYNFGEYVETYFKIQFETQGIVYFILLYIGGILFATLPAFARHSDNDLYFSLGASGAVSAVLFAFIAIDPMAELMLILIPIPLPAFVFGILYIAAEIYMDRKGGSRIAHDAHIWGAVYGFIVSLVINNLESISNVFN